MSWKEKRLITILSIILAVLCAAVLVVLSIHIIQGLLSVRMLSMDSIVQKHFRMDQI